MTGVRLSRIAITHTKPSPFGVDSSLLSTFNVVDGHTLHPIFVSINTRHWESYAQLLFLGVTLSSRFFYVFICNHQFLDLVLKDIQI